MAYELLKYSDDQVLAKAAAAEWLRELQAFAKQEPGNDRSYSVALSGGRIARNFFEEIVKQAHALPDSGKTLFASVHFFWADERCVPPDDAESNYGIARQLLLGPMGIAAEHVHRLRGEGDEAAALRLAVEEISRVAPQEGGQPILDIVFLGMGEDGHVASLFPGERAEVMSNPTVYRAVTAVKPPPRRITLGYGVLTAARKAWVLVSGKDKEQALKESLSTQGKTPLARVLRSRGETRVLTDIAGAA
jgi:6-phosphogluconolactonase